MRDLDDMAGNVRRITAAVDAARADGGLRGNPGVRRAAADRPDPRLAGRRGRGGRGRAPPEVPHRRRRGAPVPRRSDGRGLDRRRARPRDAVQVHGRAPPRRPPPRPRDRLRAPGFPQRPAGDPGRLRRRQPSPRSTQVLDDHYANDLVALAPAERPRRRAALVHVVRLVQRHRTARRPGRARPARGTPTTGVDGPGESGSGSTTCRTACSRPQGSAPRVGVRYGDTGRRRRRPCGPSWTGPTLNDFMALGPDAWADTRAEIAELVEAEAPAGDCRSTRSRCTCPSPSVTTSTSTPRSTTPPTSAGSSAPTRSRCCPNWRHLPVGYHGRGGTVVVSGTPVIRPCGQRKAPHEDAPTYGPSRRLDIEAELGFVVGVGSELGSRIAGRRVPAARLRRGRPQRLERPRHPGLGVRAARTVPRQVVRHVGERLGHTAGGARRPPAPTCRGQEPAAAPLPRRPAATQALDIDVEVVLNGEVVSRPPYRTMYWSPAQMLAHLTVNGASTRTGRPVRLGHDQRSRARPARLVPRAELGRQGAVRRRPHVPRGRRRGDPPLLRARHRRRPDHPRRGHRPDRARPRVRTGDRRVRTLALVIQYGQLAPPTHVVAHVSDTHLLAGDARQYGAIDTVARFRAALDRLTRIDPPPQALVFTGDLADLGEPEAYRALRELRRAAAPDGSARRSCGAWATTTSARRTPASCSARSPTSRRTGCTTSPGCGSSASTPACRAGTTARSPTSSSPGSADVLATPAEHGTILALHHPPIPSPLVPAAEIIELLDTERLAAVLRGTDVRAILGGHYHFTSHSTFAGIPVSVAAATCYTVDTAPARPAHLRGRRAPGGQRRPRVRRPGRPHDRAGAGARPRSTASAPTSPRCSRRSARRSGSTWFAARTRPLNRGARSADGDSRPSRRLWLGSPKHPPRSGTSCTDASRRRSS